MSDAPTFDWYRQPDRWEPRDYGHRRENGRERFFDGEECVFEIDPDACCIRYGRLRPGGEPLIGGPGRPDGWRLWWGRSNHYEPGKLQDLRVQSMDSQNVAVAVRVLDEDGMLTSTSLRFGYSSPLQSYVYEFDQTLSLPDQTPWHGTATGLYLGIEYCNFWPSGSFNNAAAGPVESPGMEPHQRGYYGREQWQWMIYEEAPGKFCAVPINRLTRSTSENMRPCDDGIFMLAEEEVSNPTLQFLDDTGGRTILGLCHAIYDVHVSLAELGRVAPGRELHAHYRLFDTPFPTAHSLIEKAEIVREPVPWVERGFVLPRAVIPGVNRFDSALDPYAPSDDYFWRPLEVEYHGAADQAPRGGPRRARTFWDREASQLVMCSPWPTFLGWGLYGANYIGVKPGKRYRFRATVDLAGVEGEGVCLASLFYHDRLDEKGEPFKPIEPTESGPVAGTASGVQLLLETEPAPDCVIDHGGVPYHYDLLDFWVVLKGQGTVRVSEIEIIEMP